MEFEVQRKEDVETVSEETVRSSAVRPSMKTEGMRVYFPTHKM